MSAPDANFADDYRALTEDVGVVDLAALRSRVELRGDDRRAFLHNFCTNDIRNLADGAGCEAFLLDAKGHVLFYVLVWCRPDGLVLDGPAGTAPAMIKHLDRYLIREKVTLHDRNDEWGELLIAGPRAAEVLKEVTGEVFIGPAPFTPDPNFVVVGPTAARWMPAGVRVCGPVALEALRIEAGFPLGDIDVDEKNLPQEVDRIEQTISFKKGCYLGQETVARLDALGHVNKTLVTLKFQSRHLAPRDEMPHAEREAYNVPPAGTPLTLAGLQVGQVTSAAYSPRAGGVIALAYVKRGPNAPGTQLESPFGPAVAAKPGTK